MITIGSNGIPEMIRAAGKSKYRTSVLTRWWNVFAWIGIATVALGLIPVLIAVLFGN